MWPLSPDRAGIAAFASLLSRIGRRLRSLPPRLRRSWGQSIRKLPGITVAIRLLDRRYAWLALAVAVLAAPGAIILALLSVASTGTSGTIGLAKPAVVAPAEPVDRTQENLAVASPPSTQPPRTPQAGATLSAATSGPGRSSAATMTVGPLPSTPTVGATRIAGEVPTPTGVAVSPRSTVTPVPGQSQVSAGTVNEAAPRPTATPPFRPTVSKLTPDGCCAAFLWADDSIHVLYYDWRNSDAAGTWLVNVETGEELLLLPLYGYFSPDRSTVAVPEPDSRQMRFRKLATDEEWVVPNLPSRVLFDPRGEHIAFTLRPAERPLERGAVGRPAQGAARILGPIAIWTVDVRGTEARALGTLPGARIHGWLPDGSALLVTWRTVGKLETSLGLLDVETGEVAIRTTAPRLLSGRLSPDGEWVAYIAAFTGDLQRDGLWVQRVRGDEARRLAIWGDYRWAPDSSSLIVLPSRPKGADGDRFWRVYVDGEFPVPLTDPTETPFAITNNSWELSTDGKRVVFTSAADHSLWLLQLRP